MLRNAKARFMIDPAGRRSARDQFCADQ